MIEYPEHMSGCAASGDEMSGQRSEWRLISAEEIIREHRERLDALSTDEVVRRVLAAVSALMDQEGERIGVCPFDWAYHGCDPAWRAVGKACADLAEKQLGESSWRAFRLVIDEERDDA